LINAFIQYVITPNFIYYPNPPEKHWPWFDDLRHLETGMKSLQVAVIFDVQFDFCSAAVLLLTSTRLVCQLLFFSNVPTYCSCVCVCVCVRA